MSNIPLVSVIVPVYNGAHTIRATLDSVFEQSYENFELIVIDDGSTDETLAVVGSFKDSRLKVFSHANAGVAASRNRGVSHAVGSYISFLDADDLWTPDKLEAQIQALETSEKAAVAYSWTDYIDESGRFVAYDQRVTFSGDVYGELLLRDFLESASNVTIRRQAFLDVQGFDQNLSGAADWDLFLRLAEQHHYAAVPRLGVLYRIGGSSMSANLEMQERECLAVLDQAFERAPAHLKGLKNQSYAQLYQYLSFKVVQGQLSRAKGVSALRYLRRSLNYYPDLAKQQPRFTSIIILKSMAALLLPSTSQQLIDRLRSRTVAM